MAQIFRQHWLLLAALIATQTVADAAGNPHASASGSSPQANAPTLEVVWPLQFAIINSSTLGATNIKYGFEGGMALFACGGWHLYMTEMFADPHWIGTRLGHWRSADGITGWTRTATLMQGSGNTNGTDERSHVDAPMLVLNETNGEWEMFYVSYWHNVTGCPITSCNGSIWRSRPKKGTGCAGLLADSFYEGDKILQVDADHQRWEGDQGDDSISAPVRAQDGSWVAFYGSSKSTQSTRAWDNGLVAAPSLAGPWERLPGPIFTSSENPVVTRLPPSQVHNGWKYVAVFDAMGFENVGDIGVSFSKNMLTWSEPVHYNVHGALAKHSWTNTTRTPQGLVWSESDHMFRLYYTAWESPPLAPPGLEFSWGAIGVSFIRIVAPPVKLHAEVWV